MKNSLLKKLTLLVSVAMVALLLAGCAAKAPEATATPAPVVEATPTVVPAG